MQLQLHRGCGTVTQSDKIPSLGQSVGTHTHKHTSSSRMHMLHKTALRKTILVLGKGECTMKQSNLLETAILIVLQDISSVISQILSCTHTVSQLGRLFINHLRHRYKAMGHFTSSVQLHCNLLVPQARCCNCTIQYSNQCSPTAKPRTDFK